MSPIKSILLALFTLPLSMLAQSDQESKIGWGVALVLPQPSMEVTQPGHVFPKTSLTTYDKPEGRPVGKLTLKATPEASLVHHVESGHDQPLPYDALQEYDYEMSGLVAYDIQGGFIKVMIEANDDQYTYRWVKTADLEAQGFRVIRYKEFLLERNHSFYPMPEKGLNLREGAGTEHKVVTKLVNGDHLIKLTGKTQGLWMEVKAEYWPMHPCEGGEKATKFYTGWIKALDDSGFPNIWYDTRGC